MLKQESFFSKYRFNQWFIVDYFDSLGCRKINWVKVVTDLIELWCNIVVVVVVIVLHSTSAFRQVRMGSVPSTKRRGAIQMIFSLFLSFFLFFHQLCRQFRIGSSSHMQTQREKEAQWTEEHLTVLLCEEELIGIWGQVMVVVHRRR